MVYIKNLLKICFFKKIKSICKSFYYLKTFLQCFQNVFGYFSFMKLISKFQDIYPDTSKITSCKNNSIWISSLFKKNVKYKNPNIGYNCCGMC